MCDPLSSLEQLPLAAACLSASIRGMSPEMHKYKGIDSDATCEAVLRYLDKIVTQHNNGVNGPDIIPSQ
jgi:hypothetical protein